MPEKPTIFRVLRGWPNKYNIHDRRGSMTVQIDIPEGAALPRELVSLADYERLGRALEGLADALKTSRVGWITATLPREISPALVKEFQVKLVALGDEARTALRTVSPDYEALEASVK